MGRYLYSRPMKWRITLLAFCLSAAGFRSEADEGRLRLDGLVSEASANNPEIRAALERYEAAKQRPGQESALPDLVFTPGYMSSGQPWPVAGLGVLTTSHVGATLSQEFPFPGKLKLKGNIASKEAEAALQQYEAVRLSVIARLKAAYHTLAYLYAAIDLLERNRDLLTRLRSRTDTPYFIGQTAQRTEVAILDARLVRMRQEKQSREREINKLCRRPFESPVRRPEDLRPAKLVASEDQLIAQARLTAPLLQREEKIIERNELALRLARKQYYPDTEVSAGYFSMGRMPDLYDLRFSIRLPIYWWKQSGAIRERRYDLDQARSAYESASQDLILEIRDEYLKAQTAEKLISAYAGIVIPDAGRAFDSYLAAYEAGTIDFMPVQGSFMTALESELDYYGEMLALNLALVRLEELTGLWPG